MRADVYSKKNILVPYLGEEIFKVEVWTKKAVFFVHAKLLSSHRQQPHKPIHQ